MRSCSVLGCRNRAGNAAVGITFHKFPHNAKQREMWIAAIGREGWTPTAHCCVCSAHFSEKDIDRTSTLRVRLKEGCVPSLPPALPQDPSTGNNMDSAVLKKRLSPKMPLGQLITTPTTTFEANGTPKDAPLTKPSSVCTREKGVTLPGNTSNLQACSAGNIATVLCLKPITGPMAGSGCYGVIRLCPTDAVRSNYWRSGVMVGENGNVCVLKSVLKKPSVQSAENISMSAGTKNIGSGRDARAERVENASPKWIEGHAEQAESKCVEGVGRECKSGMTDGGHLVTIEAEGNILTTVLVDKNVTKAVGPSMDLVAGRQPQPSYHSSLPSSQLHLIDHADMCRRQEDVVCTPDADATLPQSVYRTVCTSSNSNCPSGRPVSSCATTPSLMVLERTKPTDVLQTTTWHAENDQGPVCNHDDDIRCLQKQLDQFRALHLASRKKVKALSTCVRRHKAKKEQLKKTIEELRKKPPEDDITSGLEGIAKAGAELLKRQQLKRKGEPMPTEYSSELREFAIGLHGHSLQAYEFVRKAFNGCLPHVKTVQKWKSPSGQEGRPEGSTKALDGETVPLICSEEIVFVVQDEAVSHLLRVDPPPPGGGWLQSPK